MIFFFFKQKTAYEIGVRLVGSEMCIRDSGEAADYNKDGSWWCLTDAAGEMTSVGVADIELHDGDSYAFTYTK